MLSHRLKEARQRLGVSQEKLGQLAGIDAASASARMNQYERGKHTPDFSLMRRLAPILQLPVPWFYTPDDDMADLLEAYHHMQAPDQAYLLDLARKLRRRPRD
ncbi:Putative transcriptional regulator [plant metagenome]|uniref:Transcriptional regulator n=2 Tax=root TaxID=1 RepID=A0A1C3K1T2_9BURK|nr:helix-turn-helix transcriptional regulator [Orrella dioscoreae]SBT25473.1 Putative transcriptional regulator [Orrella dioscoreae]SOE46358.1 Putative transcriptional regulator [Orrella dioscoreae]